MFFAHFMRMRKPHFAHFTFIRDSRAAYSPSIAEKPLLRDIVNRKNYRYHVYLPSSFKVLHHMSEIEVYERVVRPHDQTRDADYEQRQLTKASERPYPRIRYATEDRCRPDQRAHDRHQDLPAPEDRVTVTEASG